MLSPYRVLDLTDDRGHMTGFLLAQLGAEVISVEPAGGQRARRIGPFAGGVADPERSLLQWSYDRGKRSVVVEGPDAAAQLERLAAEADVLIECGAPPADLSTSASCGASNPGLVTVSLSNFGASGPKAGWLATDLTLAAAAGQVALTGDLDRPPVRVSVPQVWANTASEAACAVLVALTERERSGLGQHIDVSAQEAMMLSVQGWMQPALAGAPSVQRRAGGADLLGFDFRFVYPCADGHVTTTYLPGVLVGPFTNRMLAWVHEQGGLDDELAAVDWCTLISDYDWDGANSIIQRTAVQMSACFTRWSKADLFRISLERHFLIMPIATVADVAANEQFAARQFWDDVPVESRTKPSCASPGRGSTVTSPPRTASAGRRASASTPPRSSVRPGLAPLAPPSASPPPRRPGRGRSTASRSWTSPGSTPVRSPPGCSPTTGPR